MKSLIVVHPKFEAVWPFMAGHLHTIWESQGPTELIRLDGHDRSLLSDVVADGAGIRRMIVLHVPVTEECLDHFPDLEEISLYSVYEQVFAAGLNDELRQRGIKVHQVKGEGFWGQSVSEFALALTLCGLRRIPQLHHEIITSHEPWHFVPPSLIGEPGGRGEQFGDDPRFVNGTIEGKRVRIVGAGNIASRYASFVHMLGADVAAYDPYASDPCFHRAGSRRVHYIEQLLQDADIFAPMVPLTEGTQGIVTAEHIRALPKGCLVILATRAEICDMAALRERVLSDELSLAADVFDMEPLPLGDPLLGRHNVVHTPHTAGRTIDSNKRFAQMLAEQFLPAKQA